MKSTILALTLLAGIAPAFAQSNVDLYIYRVGANAGTDTLSNAGNQAWIDKWSTNGTSFNYVRSYDAGVFASGTATSEGLLNFSPDNQYLAYTGYNTSTPVASLAGTAATTVNRTVGVLDVSTGNITRTNFTDFADKNNPRSTVTTNGTDLWMAGAGGGVRFATTTSTPSNSITTTSTQLSTTATNIRNVDIVASQLHISSSSGTLRVGTEGSGLPTSSGQTATNLNGITSTNSSSPYSFFFADLNATVAGMDTLYVADDTADKIQKYSLTGAGWGLVGGVTATDVRGLAGVVETTGVRLYGTTGSSSATADGKVYTFLDTTGYDAALSGTADILFTRTDLASALGTSAANFAFRGIELAVIPEPSTYAAIIGSLALGLAAWKRRRA